LKEPKERSGAELRERERERERESAPAAKCERKQSMEKMQETMNNSLSKQKHPRLLFVFGNPADFLPGINDAADGQIAHIGNHDE
jgi:hypothetical protein